MQKHPQRPGQRPAYFMKLCVENLRCFAEKVELDLSDGHRRPEQWTVILGAKGTGKTTVLQSLATMQPYPSESVEQDGCWDTHWHWANDEVAYDPARPIRISAQYATGVLLTERERRPAEVVAEMTVDDTDISYFTFERPSWRLAVHGYGARRRSGTGPLSPTQLAPDPVLDVVGFDAGINTLFHPDGTLINAEQWLSEMGSSKNTAHAKVDQAMNEITNLFLIDSVPSEQRTPNGNVRPRNKSNDGHTSHCVRLLRAQPAMSWIVDLAARMFERYPESISPLKENAVVLVDEIDLYLKPRQQRKHLKQLQTIFPNVQFIVTAQNALISRSIQSANVYQVLPHQTGGSNGKVSTVLRRVTGRIEDVQWTQ